MHKRLADSVSPAEPQAGWGLGTCPVRRSCRTALGKPGEEAASWGTQVQPPAPWRLARVRFFTTQHCKRTRDSGHNLKWEVQTAYKGKLFAHEDRQAMEEAAKRECAVSILAGVEDPTGESSEQPGLSPGVSLLWAGGWTKELVRYFPAWDIQWAYSVILEKCINNMSM